ncbi:MAG: hypothetical protein QFB87_00915 [Patescibacteria group bacterium]|nr:hypothetical protein [Patescibacteria group bacterium]
MYRLGHKLEKPRSRKPLWFSLALIAVLLIGGLIFASKQLRAPTTVTQAAPVIRKVTANSVPVKGFDEPGFDIELPSDWKLAAHLTSPYNLYRFQGTGKADVNRMLDVYQDTIPKNFMVNRVQPLEANGEKITPLGSMSENCADFTRGPSVSGQQGTPAKWEGIDFLCDLNNYQRNVVGTTTKGSINTITLKSATGNTHQFFFAYTDNSINANYTTFYSALTSFSTK